MPPCKVALLHPGLSLECTLPLCVEAKAGHERPLGGRMEPAFKQKGASIQRPPLSPQITGDLIIGLRELCKKSNDCVFDPLDVRLRV